MARRIRWQIVVAVIGSLLVIGLLVQLALATTAVSEPLVGGTYVEAVPGVPEQVIPLLNNSLTDPTGQDIGALLFDGLTRIGFDGLPTTALAEAWQVEQDGTVYIFQLRDDVTWHDGEPFDADDVLFTIGALQDETFTANPQLSAFWSSVLLDRLDDYTIRFTLTAPYAPFPTAARVPILPEHLLGTLAPSEWATSTFAARPIGTGPYQIEELTTERALLTANQEYFLRRPYIDQIELRFVESTQATLPILNEGEIAALGASSLAAPELPQVALPGNLRRASVPLDEYSVLTFNLRDERLAELQLRQALAQALDKDALVEQVFNGQVLRIDNPILPGWWAHDPTIGWYPYNPGEASQRLQALGYLPGENGIREQDGTTLALPLITDGDPGRLAAAAEIAAQWQVLGVAIEIEELDSATLRQRLQERAFVLALHGWSRVGPDPDMFTLWHSSQADNGLNYAGLVDETIDEALAQGRSNTENATRNAHYATFQQRWVEQIPSITLYQPLYTFIVNEEVGGIRLEQAPIGSGNLLVGREDRYRDVTNWFVNSSREVRGTLR